MRKTLQRLIFLYFLCVYPFLLLLRALLDSFFLHPFWLAIVSLVISCGAALLTRYFYVEKILEVNRMAKKIIDGDFSQRLNIGWRHELGDLARNLNLMSEELQNKIQKITEDKNELQAILSSLVEGVVVINADERIVYISPNFYDLLEVRSKEMVGRAYWEVIRNQEINETIKEAFYLHKDVKKEIMILAPQEAYFSMQISPVLNREGGVNSIVAIFHDITELKKFERMRTEFVANVSHELKTPLTSIKGFVETLSSGALEDHANAKRFLNIIAQQADRLESLVNDLLTLSVLESQEVKLDLKDEDLPKIIQAVCNLLKASFEKKYQSLSVLIEPGIPQLKLDRIRIEQALLNLLDNAIKFTPDNGKINIRVLRDNGYVRIDVEDSGIGIPQEHLSRIFERFYRVDKARSKELGGTGLGLSIVKHIVQSHQGKVSVKSAAHKGAVFSVFLPFNP